MLFFRRFYFVDSCGCCLAPCGRYLGGYGIAEEFLLFLLRSDEHVIVAESLDALHFGNPKHTHCYVYNSIEDAELFHAHHFGNVVRLDSPGWYSLLDGHQIRRTFVHPGDQRETRRIHRAAGGPVLRVQQVVGVYESLFRYCHQCSAWCVHGGYLSAAGEVVGDKWLHQLETVFCCQRWGRPFNG